MTDRQVLFDQIFRRSPKKTLHKILEITIQQFDS